jgi:ankyrin repeat protein
MNVSMLSLLQGNTELYPQELEKKFPRILNKMVELWGTPQMEPYLTDLMIDSRGGTRQGFPMEIANEIYRLSMTYERLLNQSNKQTDDPWASIDSHKRQEIEALGYHCTTQDFLKSAENQDRTAVGKYLSAGFAVDTRDERGWTPLMISSFNGNEEIAQLLIQSGASVNVKDTAGYGPMHWAAFNGYANVINLLIDRQADVNAQSQHGWTPLLQGATRGHLPACSALIAGGANVNLASNDGWTALHKACANGHLEVVKLLLSHGADRNAQYQNGITPLALATKSKRQDIVAALLLH